MSFFDKAKNLASEGLNKAKDTVEMTRISTQVSGKRKDIEQLFTKIGETVYLSKNEQDAASIVNEYCSQVSALESEISELEDAIRHLKDEKKCTNCAKILPLHTKFCPDCGQSFEDSAAESQ